MMYKYIFIYLAILCESSSVIAQYNKLIEDSKNMVILRETPFYGKFCIVQAGRKYEFNDVNLSRFRVLNDSYFYAYNKAKHSDCLFYFNGNLETFYLFNRDSFSSSENKRLNITLDKSSFYFNPGNDTMCLLYCSSKNQGFFNKHYIYQYSFKINKIIRLIYSTTAYGLKLGNDPVSINNKLGMIIYRGFDSTNQLIIVDIQSGKKVKIINNVAYFSFVRDTNILLTSVGGILTILDANANILSTITLKKGYSISEINSLHHSTIYLRQQRRRYWGERYKILDMKFDIFTFKMQQINFKQNGIIDF